MKNRFNKIFVLLVLITVCAVNSGIVLQIHTASANHDSHDSSKCPICQTLTVTLKQYVNTSAAEFIIIFQQINYSFTPAEQIVFITNSAPPSAPRTAESLLNCGC